MNQKKSEKLGFLKQITGSLTSPRTTFKSILQQPSLLKATALILVIAVITGWASRNYAGKLPLPTINQPETGQGMGFPMFFSSEPSNQSFAMLATIAGFTSIFGSWLISSVLLYAFSRVQGGKGSFQNMLILAGYASTPYLIQQILRLIDSFITSSEVLQSVERITLNSSNILFNSFVNSTLNGFSIFMLWSIALFIIALRENYELSTSKSIVAAAGTYIIPILLQMFRL